MKKLFFGAMMALAAATFVACGNSTPKADLKNEVDTLSYAMGMATVSGFEGVYGRTYGRGHSLYG